MANKMPPKQNTDAAQPANNVGAGEQNSYHQQAVDDMHDKAHAQNNARRNVTHKAGKMPAPTNVK